MYKNNGNNTFTEQTSIQIQGIHSGDLAWADYNNDGFLDILISGRISDSFSDAPITKIYKNNGGNGFQEQTDIILPGLEYGAVAWADYNNDGQIDFVLTGRNTERESISKIYKNNGDNTFTVQSEIVLEGVYVSDVDWGDYNNDGYLDLLYAGSKTSYLEPDIKLYMNNGNGTFTEHTSSQFIGVYKASLTWGDYNSDGFLDILLTGGIRDDPDYISKVYKNNGDNSFAELTNLSLQGRYAGSDSWIDYDNDGDLDIFINGEEASAWNARIYKNNGSDNFTHQSNIRFPIGSYGAAPWADYDNDGDPDLAFTAHSQGKLYKNTTTITNTRPAAPVIVGSQQSDNVITLSWNPATDDKTPTEGLSYNIQVGTSSGANDVVSSNADADGFLRLPAMGNAQLGTNYILKDLPEGKYYWRVQAIDNCYKGGAFSDEGSFEIDGGIVTDIDGNSYNTISIGKQVWMKSNLITTQLNDGTPIPNITDNTQWMNLTTPAYCWYNNSSADELVQGKLYNAYTVDTENLCPTGWHIPTAEDFEVLIEHLGGDDVAGGKLKNTGTAYWNAPNTAATNESEFALNASGMRYNSNNNGRFAYKGEVSYLWSHTEYEWPVGTVNQNEYLFVGYDSPSVSINPKEKACGFPVRCLKNKTGDDDNAIPNISKSNISIYPNPATDYFFIKNAQNVSVLSIYNLQGSMVKQIQKPSNRVNITDLAKGIYIIKVTSANREYSFKLRID